MESFKTRSGMFLRGDDMPAPRTISFNPFSGKSRVVVPERKATRDDWKTCDMPEMHVVTEFRMDLTPEQMDTLSWGHVPLEMEDKWFSYMEDGRLHIHRSWTGFCIYIVEFSRDGRHRVTINRDPDEYTNTDLDKDMEMLAALIGMFSASENDPYAVWIGDTARTLGDRSRE